MLLMPKELLLVRHAKSDWNDPKLSDFDRPLNARGHMNAPEMAKRLAARNIIPGLIISSPAIRAFTTAKYFADELGLESDQIKCDRDIYEASTQDLMRVICGFDDHFDRIVLFGHNPGITLTANILSGESISNIATCGVVLLRFDIPSWKMVSADSADLVFYDFPKNK